MLKGPGGLRTIGLVIYIYNGDSVSPIRGILECGRVTVMIDWNV